MESLQQDSINHRLVAMNWFKVIGMVLAVLLVLMSLAHGMLGWPAVSAELVQAGVVRGSEAWNDAAAGWIFGSVSMFVFGVIFASVVLSLCKGKTNVAPVIAIALGYLAFGIGASAMIQRSPHFVGFAVFGLLFLIWGLAAPRMTCPISERKN